MAKKQDAIELLLQKSLITKEQLEEAKRESKRSGLPTEQVLEKLGFITEEDITNVRASALGVPYMDLKGYLIDAEVIKLVPEALARKHNAVPLFKIGNTLTLAMSDPRNIFALDEIRMKTNLIIEPAVAAASEIKKAMDE